jgi:hypothetical protein
LSCRIWCNGFGPRLRFTAMLRAARGLLHAVCVRGRQGDEGSQRESADERVIRDAATRAHGLNFQEIFRYVRLLSHISAHELRSKPNAAGKTPGFQAAERKRQYLTCARYCRGYSEVRCG